MDTLAHIETLLRTQPRKPPLDKWHPPLSGTIDIRIDSRGDWYHEGTRIERKPLVNLFASILRREGDGDYYLVTPVEKWRIAVEDTALLAVDMDIGGSGADQKVVFTLNTDEHVLLSTAFPLSVEVGANAQPHPLLQLERGLSARLTRAVFYRLVEAAQMRAERLAIGSDGQWFDLGACV
jgi:hypothetical protein